MPLCQTAALYQGNRIKWEIIMFKIFERPAKTTDKNHVTGHQRFFDIDEVIVSKTDLKGKITYANDVFIRISGYNDKQLMGQPHSIIRHPDMPRCVFKLLWQKLNNGQEIFAYVNNRCRNGDHYWVFAHVTPSFDANHQIVSYHSSRRRPKSEIISNSIAPLYAQLLAVEKSEISRKVGLEASFLMLNDFIAKQGMSYEELILSM